MFGRCGILKGRTYIRFEKFEVRYFRVRLNTSTLNHGIAIRRPKTDFILKPRPSGRVHDFASSKFYWNFFANIPGGEVWTESTMHKSRTKQKWGVAKATEKFACEFNTMVWATSAKKGSLRDVFAQFWCEFQCQNLSDFILSRARTLVYGRTFDSAERSAEQFGRTVR